MYKITGEKPLFNYEIRVRLPDGSQYRERRESPARTLSATERWVQERQAHLLAHGKEKPEAPKACPTLKEFLPRWWDAPPKKRRAGVVGSRRTALKPSVVHLYETNFKADLLPFFGDMRLAKIGIEAVDRYRTSRTKKGADAIDNELGLLKSVLRLAVSYSVIDKMPEIETVLSAKKEARFYTAAEFETLVKACPDAMSKAVVLLGGEAGLRSGEMLFLAAHTENIDEKRSVLHIKGSIWCGKETATKTGVDRQVPATPRLLAALKGLNGESLGSYRFLQSALRRAQKAAGFEAHGHVHSLRHTFCTRLFSGGARERDVQDLAGHATPGMSKHYTHRTADDTRKALFAALTSIETGNSESITPNESTTH